jgi:hypothetical protein
MLEGARGGLERVNLTLGADPRGRQKREKTKVCTHIEEHHSRRKGSRYQSRNLWFMAFSTSQEGSLTILKRIGQSYEDPAERLDREKMAKQPVQKPLASLKREISEIRGDKSRK